MEIHKAAKTETVTNPFPLEVSNQERPLKFLVVEDDKSQWPIWGHILNSLDRKVIVDWETTQERAQVLLTTAYQNNTTYDVVISDVYLEGQGIGTELWNKYGEAADHFIFVTGTSLTAEDLQDQLDFGHPQFLKKPISVSNGRRLLQEICNLKKTGGES